MARQAMIIQTERDAVHGEEDCSICGTPKRLPHG
jgi:hypothetical protein